MNLTCSKAAVRQQQKHCRGLIDDGMQHCRFMTMRLQTGVGRSCQSDSPGPSPIRRVKTRFRRLHLQEYRDRVSLGIGERSAASLTCSLDCLLY